jgi:hypothetical protein
VLKGLDLAGRIPTGIAVADVDAFTATRRVTVRGGIAPYPF